MMKKIVAAILCLFMVVSMASCGNATVDADLSAAQQAKQWMNKQIKNNTLVSFTYDGQPYADHIKSWDKEVTEEENQWKITYTKDGLELAIDAVYNEKHASLEYVGKWTNSSSENTKVISEILMLDSDFEVAQATMTTATSGGMHAIDDYQPVSTKLEEGMPIRKANTGGRSTQSAWPYFDLVSGDASHGIMLAIGWTGNWKCAFTQNGEVVRVQAGMQNTKYYMEAGETFRTPSIVLQFFKGDQDAGHNAWRQLVLEEYTPIDQKTGENVRHAYITINTWGGNGSDVIIDRGQSAVDAEQYFEYLWIDAGWYGDVLGESANTGEWRTELGKWYYNPGFPNGFDDIRKWVDDNNTGLLVWFEWGRAPGGNPIHAEHPEYFLPTTSEAFEHYDIGNPEACDYIIDIILGFLDDMDCDIYRQDYNMDPSMGWNAKDKVLDPNGNRNGVAEIQYVTGHYRLLDAILASGRMIDNCASGGRQLDIEMSKRGIPLWRSDYTAQGAGVQTVASGMRSQGANLSWWIPISGGAGTSEGVNTEYGFRSYMASGCTVGTLPSKQYANKMIGEMLHNRELMLGDYYILKQGLGGDTDAVNAGYQYYRTDMGEGYLVCFRPNLSNEEYTTFVLKGLESEATYEVRNADTDQKLTMTGEELMTDGLKVYFPTIQVAHMIYFTKQ